MMHWLFPLHQTTSKRFFNSCVLFFGPAIPRLFLNKERKYNTIVYEIIIKQNDQNILDTTIEFLYIGN